MSASYCPAGSVAGLMYVASTSARCDVNGSTYMKCSPRVCATAKSIISTTPGSKHGRFASTSQPAKCCSSATSSTPVGGACVGGRASNTIAARSGPAELSTCT